MDEKQLSDKAAGILKNRLAKSKDIPSEATSDEVETILREVHQRARKSHSSGPILSQSSLYLCRVLVHLKEEDAVVRIYQESWDDYMSRKASQTNYAFFQDLVRHFPAIASKFRDSILSSSTKAVNAYRRCQAFQLLGVVLSQPSKVCILLLRMRIWKTSDDPGKDEPLSVPFQKSLQQTVLDLANGAVDDEGNLNAGQLKDLLKVVLLCVRQVQKATQLSGKPDVWDPSAWSMLHTKLSSSDRFKSSSALLAMCRQVESIALQLKSEARSSEGGKRKAHEVTGDASSSKKSDRKKQKKDKS